MGKLRLFLIHWNQAEVKLVCVLGKMGHEVVVGESEDGAMAGKRIKGKHAGPRLCCVPRAAAIACSETAYALGR